MAPTQATVPEPSGHSPDRCLPGWRRRCVCSPRAGVCLFPQRPRARFSFFPLEMLRNKDPFSRGQREGFTQGHAQCSCTNFQNQAETTWTVPPGSFQHLQGLPGGGEGQADGLLQADTAAHTKHMSISHGFPWDHPEFKKRPGMPHPRDSSLTSILCSW